MIRKKYTESFKNISHPSKGPTDPKMLEQTGFDFIWLLQSARQELPLFTRFCSLLVTESLPQNVITYMDPISKPPTINDVVHETMICSTKVANEMHNEYVMVTYDLAVALQAYFIQALPERLTNSLYFSEAFISN